MVVMESLPLHKSEDPDVKEKDGKAGPGPLAIASPVDASQYCTCIRNTPSTHLLA